MLSNDITTTNAAPTGGTGTIINTNPTNTILSSGLNTNDIKNGYTPADPGVIVIGHLPNLPGTNGGGVVIIGHDGGGNNIPNPPVPNPPKPIPSRIRVITTPNTNVGFTDGNQVVVTDGNFDDSSSITGTLGANNALTSAQQLKRRRNSGNYDVKLSSSFVNKYGNNIPQVKAIQGQCINPNGNNI